MTKRCRVSSAEPGALELNHLLDQLERLKPPAEWFDDGLLVKLLKDAEADDAWDAAVASELKWLNANELLRVYGLWEPHYGLYVEVLDMVCIAAFHGERDRVEKALDALKKTINGKHSH